MIMQLLSFITNFKSSQDIIFNCLEEYQNFDQEVQYRKERELSVSDSQEESYDSDDEVIQ